MLFEPGRLPEKIHQTAVPARHAEARMTGETVVYQVHDGGGPVRHCVEQAERGGRGIPVAEVEHKEGRHLLVGEAAAAVRRNCGLLAHQIQH